MDIRIHLERDGERVMTARLHGVPWPLTADNLARTVARFPLAAALSVPRITWRPPGSTSSGDCPCTPAPTPTAP